MKIENILNVGKNIFIINLEHLVYINRTKLQIYFLTNSLHSLKFRVIWKKLEVTPSSTSPPKSLEERRLQDAEVTTKFYIVFY